ncbi:MAG: peptide chain release factor N(5)-glutamine methyltransferase [Dehalococcoidia bacterium]
MNARAVAARAAARLDAIAIPDSRLEAEILTRHAMGLDRAAFFAGAEIDSDRTALLDALIARRAAGEPAAYITGEREFYGLAFAVGPGVLVPRPETELLVDVAINFLRDRPGSVVVDIGTGSGCVAVAVAAHAPDTRVVAIDRSTDALAWARANVARHRAPVSLVRGNLAEPLARADVVLANLPYIPTGEIHHLQREIRDFEPRSALDGGPDGLDLIRRLVADCGFRLRPSLLALEVGAGQAQAVARLAQEAGAAGITIVPDLAGIDRVVSAQWA